MFAIVKSILTSEEQPEPVDAAVIPDRADAPVSEITERFLKMVLAHVPLDRIEELHLFSPLRQGGVETGIAVIAARVPIVAAPEPTEEPQLPFEASVVDELPVDEVPVDDVPVDELPVDEVAIDDVPVDEGADDEVVTDDAILEPVAEVIADVIADEGADDELAADDAIIEAPPAPRVRHTVYTARYRLVQKGPERGKWEANVVAEAEAPLITVDLVVRGVQRRAGEESEIVRYSSAQLARALRLPSSVV